MPALMAGILRSAKRPRVSGEHRRIFVRPWCIFNGGAHVPRRLRWPRPKGGRIACLLGNDERLYTYDRMLWVLDKVPK